MEGICRAERKRHAALECWHLAVASVFAVKSLVYELAYNEAHDEFVSYERTHMKTATIAGIVLVVLGIVSLAYQGITYTTQKRVVDVGSLHATKDEKHTIPLPPVLGGLLLIGGVVLLAYGSKPTGTR
jgi:uncharacterized membrane protein